MIVLLVVLPLNGTARSLSDVHVLSFRLDHLLHVALFFPWTWACVWAFGPKYATFALFVGMMAAISLEGLQYFLPYRSFNINDLLSNAVGVLLGASWLGWMMLCRRERWFHPARAAAEEEKGAAR